MEKEVRGQRSAISLASDFKPLEEEDDNDLSRHLEAVKQEIQNV
jgi:hypothetical protein